MSVKGRVHKSGYPDFSDPDNWFWDRELEYWRPAYTWPGMRMPPLPSVLRFQKSGPERK